MAKSRRLLTVGALGVAAAALIATGSGVTGAYFTDSASGSIHGTLGTVKVTTSETNFNWTNMMPGEPKSATVDFHNAGTGNQDFYLVFKNVPALHALNNLGTYGEVHIAIGDGTHLFDSANLQDGRHQVVAKDGTLVSSTTNTCNNVFAQTDPANNGCWPLPTSLKLASNVATGGGGSFTFSFNYAGKLGTASHSSGGGTFNTFPLAGSDIFAGTAGTADGAGPADSGLPYQIVATQVGQTP